MSRSYNPIWYDNDKRKHHCLSMAEIAERLFRVVTGASKSTHEEDLRHIDCHWNGKKVDVKGLKPMHKEGYILVEFRNTWGTAGWCSKESEAEYIAFQFTNSFMIVEKNKLRELALSKLDQWDENKVWRQNRIKAQDGLHKWCGRDRSKDVFTYVEVSEVKKIIDEEVFFSTNFFI
jgi:hypothetical protein